MRATSQIDLTAILPSKGLEKIAFTRLFNAFKELAPNDALSETLSADGHTAAEASALMLTCNGLSMAVRGFSGALAIADLVYGPSPNFLWMTAEQDLGAHTAHYRVMVIDKPESRADLLAAARALTLLTAAVCQTAPMMGVLWCPSDHLVPVDRFIQSAKTLAAEGQTLADIWVRLAAVHGPGGLIVAAHGLAPYAAREVEFEPTQKLDFGTLGMRALQMSLYLIDSGRELLENDKVGSEPFKVSLADQGEMQDGPIYRMTAPA